MLDKLDADELNATDVCIDDEAANEPDKLNVRDELSMTEDFPEVAEVLRAGFNDDDTGKVKASVELEDADLRLPVIACEEEDAGKQPPKHIAPDTPVDVMLLPTMLFRKQGPVGDAGLKPTATHPGVAPHKVKQAGKSLTKLALPISPPE